MVQLAAERQHLTSMLKMLAFQAETDLVRRMTPHYRRADDEARTFIQSALANAGTSQPPRPSCASPSCPSAHPPDAALVALCAELGARGPRGRLVQRFLRQGGATSFREGTIMNRKGVEEVNVFAMGTD